MPEMEKGVKKVLIVLYVLDNSIPPNVAFEFMILNLSIYLPPIAFSNCDKM